MEQYLNLELRCEVLEAEELTLIEAMKSIEQQRRAEEKQITGIEREQQKIQKEIVELHKRYLMTNK